VIVASPPCQEFSSRAMPFKRGKAERPEKGQEPEWWSKTQAQMSPAEFAEWQEWQQTHPLPAASTALFDACMRIARQCGVPIVLENVCGTQKWIGRANARFGSYFLWGAVGNVGGRVVRADVPPRFGESLRAARRTKKRPGRNFHAFENGLGSSPSFNGGKHETRGVKGAEPIGTDVPEGTGKGLWFFGARADPRDMRRNEDELAGVKRPGRTISAGFNNWPKDENGAYVLPDGSRVGGDLESEGVKQRGSGPEWFDKALDEWKAAEGTKAGGDWFGTYADEKEAGTISPTRTTGARSNARKAASTGRDLMAMLSYATWDKFDGVVEKAMEAATHGGYDPKDHFSRTAKMVLIGSGAQRDRADWYLTRLACYFIAMNADSSKPEVGLAMTYFAVQTRRQEVLQKEMEQLSEEEKRIQPPMLGLAFSGGWVLLILPIAWEVVSVWRD
jgi:hypothetical protein